jgi:hypothetical protein
VHASRHLRRWRQGRRVRADGHLLIA